MPFHPVTADDINAKLRAIESEHQVHVLLACESGSRSFGFDSFQSVQIGQRGDENKNAADGGGYNNQ